MNENSRSALAFYSMLLPLNQCLCLSINAFTFHWMRLPFTQCVCLSHNACAFHSMHLPFKPICLPVNQCFGLSLNASVFHCEWQDLYLIQCTCQVNPHSSVQQELLASVCTAVLSCSVQNIYSLSHVPAHYKGGGQGDGVRQQVAGGGGGQQPTANIFFKCNGSCIHEHALLLGFTYYLPIAAASHSPFHIHSLTPPSHHG